MKKQLIRAAATTVLGLSLTTGLAAAQSINQTGQDSQNKISTSNSSSMKVKNHNNVGVGNVNLQGAVTGDAHSSRNTTGGNAASGDASNSNDNTTNVSVSNSGGGAPVSMDSSDPGDAAISNTGQDSKNTITTTNKSTSEVNNDNNVGVLNFNGQFAASGNASSSKNTTGGSATTGDASNDNTTATTVTIEN